VLSSSHIYATRARAGRHDRVRSIGRTAGVRSKSIHAVATWHHAPAARPASRRRDESIARARLAALAMEGISA